jgi:hypothetical protein
MFNLHKKFPEKNIFFLNNNNFFKVIEKTEQTLSTEGFFKTLIDLSLDFFQKLCVTFSLGCFQTFWTLMLKNRRNGKGCSFNILVASPIEIFCFEKRMSQR